MKTRDMLQSHPKSVSYADALQRCIDKCYECAQTCSACADACLGEEMVHRLIRCIRTDLDCADVCEATGRVLSRQTELDASVAGAMLDACRTACQVCADECETHVKMHEHCEICATACRECDQACERLLAAIG